MPEDVIKAKETIEQAYKKGTIAERRLAKSVKNIDGQIQSRSV